MTNGNDFAHPTDVWCESRNGDFYQEGTDPGLTKREYFAAMAMQGFLAAHKSYVHDYRDGFLDGTQVGKCSVMFADALIEALNAERPSTGR